LGDNISVPNTKTGLGKTNQVVGGAMLARKIYEREKRNINL